MKILFALLLSAVTALAQVPPPTPVPVDPAPEYYKAGLSFDVFGSARTPDLNDYRTGLGFGANLWFANNLGIGVEALTENTSNEPVDNIAAHGLWRLVSGKAGLNILAGAGQDLERDETFISLGTGPEYAITRHLHIFSEARAIKPVEGSDIHALFKAGVRWQW